MTDYVDGEARPASIQEQEKYLLHSSREIIPILKALIAKPDLITAQINGGDQAMMTAVLDVLPKQKLVVLDYGPNEAINKKMAASAMVAFSTRHDMIEVRFSCNAINRVKYKGASAFAAPMPDSLLWLQRREYFRIKPLISGPVYCQLNRVEPSPQKLNVADISINGLAILYDDAQLVAPAGKRFENCTLYLPDNPDLPINLDIRYSISTLTKCNQRMNRAGGLFSSLRQHDEYTIQRFINMTQLEQNALHKD